MQRFFLVLDVESDAPHDKFDIACWVDDALTGVTSTVFDSLGDMVLDSVEQRGAFAPDTGP